MRADCEGPLPVGQLGVESEGPVGSRLLEAVFVLGVDFSVIVAVHIGTFDRVAVGVVDLLVYEERVGSMSGLVDLDIVSGTSGDASGLDSVIILTLVVGGQLGDLGLVVGGVEAYGPAPVHGLDGNSVDLELYTLVGKVADIGVQIVGEVGSCCHGSVVEQVLGVSLVEVDRAGDAVVDESEVETYVVGRRGLPLKVGVVSERSDRHDDVVPEEVHRLVGVVLVGREGRVVSGLEVLLSGLSPAEPELERGEP